MAITLRNIYKSFGEKHVLTDFSLELTDRITCIMGPSGKGKTTIVNIIAGLLEPDSGELVIAASTRFSYVFQDDRLLERESALTNVLFVTEQPRNNIERAVSLLSEADLADNTHTKAVDLSGGMKRRVAICRALIADYDVLILDEPFKGLDAAIKPRIMDMVKQQSGDKSVLVITHDPYEAEYLGGAVVRL